MERVNMMDCGDGIRRANNGCFGRGPYPKTAAYTILAADTGKVFSNAGATGPVTLTLPAAKAGLYFIILKAVAQNILLQAPAGSKVGNSTAAKILQNVTDGDAGTGMVTLYCDGTDYWPTAKIGTWAANNA